MHYLEMEGVGGIYENSNTENIYGVVSKDYLY